MVDLRKRFGLLVKAHRRRCGMTQDALAEATGLSIDMISKVEVGGTGTSFPVIEKIASALSVDPAELFTAQGGSAPIPRGSYANITTRLVGLSESDLRWVEELLEVALKRRS